MPVPPAPADQTTAIALDRAEVLLMSGDTVPAMDLCAAILREQPDHPDANYLLGIAHMSLGQPEAAATCLEAATIADPGHEDAWLRRGAALIAQARFTEAAECLRRLLALCPDDVAGRRLCGFCLSCLGEFAAAVAVMAPARALAPDDDTLAFLYASALIWTEGSSAAMRDFVALTDRSPDFAAGWFGRSLLHLLVGDYTIGWHLYEWRLKLPEHAAPARIDAAQRWHGTPEQRGKTVLLHTDAGFGDIVQFVRFVPMAAVAGMRVVLRVPRPLVRLLRSVPGVAAIHADTDPLPPSDLQCPITSLALVFGTTLATIPAAVPYLAAPPDTLAAWRARMADVPGVRVGLVWAAAPRPEQISTRAHGRRKSVPLEALAPLAAVPGVSFVSLQLGPAADEPPAGMRLIDPTAAIADFADTAAIIASLDLVISVDTAVAHLAGALARPVWLLNPFDSDWRWMLDRNDNPWYPTLRVFRQPHSGDWGSVVRDVAAALHRFAASA